MKVYGGLSLEKDNLFFSFVLSKKKIIIPYVEGRQKISYSGKDLRDFIIANIDEIDGYIRSQEKKHSFKMGDIFFKLPSSYAKIKILEDVVPLSFYKKLTLQDIVSIKKQMENIALDLGDYCLHHIIMEYRIGEKIFYNSPIGEWAKKVFLKSMLITIPYDLYDTFRECFSNVNRKFSTFIHESIAEYSALYRIPSKVHSFIIKIKEKATFLWCFLGRRLLFERVYEFGEDNIIEEIAKRFRLPEYLAKNLVINYSSFDSLPHDKEISIKNGDRYFTIEATIINSIVKEVIKNNMEEVIHDINKIRQQKDYTVSFVGELTERDGFYTFMKGNFNLNIHSNSYFRERCPAAFGCVYYGKKMLFEKDIQDSLWCRVVNVFREYF